ncbi:MAG: hypothetical protein R6V06_00070 [Kiritimatiellia bacterium]
MDRSNNGPLALANRVVSDVWYSGTDALKKGEAVCYNTDYGTPATFVASRGNRVERPSSSNNMAFAGVAERNYPARAGGQMITINCPGSTGVDVALGANVTINAGILTFTVGSGGVSRFVKGGFKGRGSIVPRQTVADAVIEADMTGAWSLSTDGLTLTVTDATGLDAGDTVVILGGEIESSTKYVVPGKYTISSIDGNDIVLTSSAVSLATSAAVTCTGYAYTGNPTCQADLLDGDESGGVEFLSPPNAGVVGLSYMTNGISYICGEVTLAADADITFADGTVYGERKGFICLGTMATSEVTVDLATEGVALAGNALVEINAIDAADDGAILEWNGEWRTVSLLGAAAESNGT